MDGTSQLQIHAVDSPDERPVSPQQPGTRFTTTCWAGAVVDHNRARHGSGSTRQDETAAGCNIRHRTANADPSQIPLSILRKSSWPFVAFPSAARPETEPECAEPLASAVTTTRAFLLPNPALGREAAERGMNKPPVAVVGTGAVARPPRAFGADVSRLSSESCSVCPLKTMGSECKSSFPASWNHAAQVNTIHGLTRDIRLTAGVSSSTIASLMSWNTSTRCTRAYFSRTWCNKPSCVPAGRPRIRTDRLRTSSVRLPPAL